jgi:hypothetical protein
MGNTAVPKNGGDGVNICPRALNAECDVYDGWEPDEICILKGGVGCPIKTAEAH